jgi:hypothetical protein
MNAKYLFIVFSVPAFFIPGVAAAEGESGSRFQLSAGVALIWLQDSNAYAGRAGSALEGMGADMGGGWDSSFKAVPVLTQTWRAHPNISLELKERFWRYVVNGAFSFAPDMGYRLEKDVIPVNLLVKFGGFNSSRSFWGGVVVGPGAYVVWQDEAGRFGSGGSGTYVNAGVHAGGEIVWAVSTALNIRFDISYDWFLTNRTSRFLGDAGNGGGPSATFGFEFNL